MKVVCEYPLSMGDMDIFDELFRAYYPPLCHFTENIVGSKEDAEDIIEDLFLKLWNKEQSFTDFKHAQSFLYLSARNAALNFLKHGKIVTATYDVLVNESMPMEDDHLHEMIRAEVWGEIYRAIEGLPSQCARVITMSYIDGKNNQEIANELGLSVQTVKNTKTRGLQSLKGTLPESLFLFLIIQPLL